MKFRKSFLLLFLIPLVAFNMHKYYLSLTQIEFNSNEKSVQIITNVFMDDIETALNKDHNIDAQLTTQKEYSKIDSLFSNYLNKNLLLKINNSEKEFSYLGKEYEGDIVYFYLEIENIEDVSSIEIKNTLLLEHFPDQQNLVKAKVNNNHKSKMLTLKNNKGLLKFNK